MDRIVFSTDALPRRQRFSAYCEEILRPSCGLELRTADQSSFRAHLEFRRVDTIDIMTNTLTAIDTARTAKLVRDGDDALLVMLLMNGHAYQTQFGDDHELHAGDAIICDSAYPGEFNLLTNSKLLSLKVPRMKLGALLPHMTRFAGVTLGRDRVALRLLSDYLAGTFDVDFGGSEEVARLHQDFIIDLVALALGTEGDARALAEQRGAQAVRRAAVVQAIAASMADPALDATMVAARLGITVRYVHHLLQPTGRSFSELLLDKRLARAVELLCETGQRHRKIADISFEVGFKDLSYFNRTFRRKYGATPSDMRLAAGGAREPL
jgi:AraC-like DNA-binding protein